MADLRFLRFRNGLEWPVEVVQSIEHENDILSEISAEKATPDVEEDESGKTDDGAEDTVLRVRLLGQKRTKIASISASLVRPFVLSEAAEMRKRSADVGTEVAQRLGRALDEATRLLQAEAVERARSRLEQGRATAVMAKREDYIRWDDYFMAVAFLSAMRSKDPGTQVGACIVNQDQRIVGIGYNGFPRGCSDDVLPWARAADDELDTKYPYVCHAELNAILNKNSADVNGCKIYVALFPCNECTKLIIQSGIREVVYVSDKYAKTKSIIASKRMLDMAGVTYRQHIPRDPSILIDFNRVDS